MSAYVKDNIKPIKRYKLTKGPYCDKEIMLNTIKLSHDERTQSSTVGCIIFDNKNNLLSTGINYKKQYTIHAELDAISKLVKTMHKPQLYFKKLYVTLSPCKKCEYFLSKYFLMEIICYSQIYNSDYLKKFPYTEKVNVASPLLIIDEHRKTIDRFDESLINHSMRKMPFEKIQFFINGELKFEYINTNIDIIYEILQFTPIIYGHIKIYGSIQPNVLEKMFLLACEIQLEQVLFA